jgi:hypothetical protein
MWVFIPPTMHRAGSTHRPIKATIFHAVPVVREGRTRKIAASMMLRTI